MYIPEPTARFAAHAEGWVAARSEQARSLWAKSGDGISWLSLPQHMVDSACAASLVFHGWLAQSVKRFLREELGVGEGELETLYVWLAGVHDAGKATVSFQRLLLERSEFAYLVSQVSDAGLDIIPSVAEQNLGKLPHNVASGVIVGQWLQDKRWPADRANALTSILNAHHGRASQVGDDVRLLIEDYPEPWKAVQRELLKAMGELVGVDKLLDSMRTRKLSVPAAQLLTGLVIMADWIASNERLFTLSPRTGQRDRVEAAASGLDLTMPWQPSDQRWEDVDAGYRSAFGWPDSFAPRQVQRAVVEAVSGVDKPVLVVIEAETGVGKTEAGLAAAEILAARAGAQGVFFAAPTMATANGLLERTIEWARNTGGEDVRSLYLAHTKNVLSQPFQDLRFKGIGDEVGGKRSVVASQWMSGRRLGLLSNVVVGTIDQVLMMALKQRFSMLRHAGLAGKVVIFDEVHAFDVYTSDYLSSTIEWLRYYGASVVLMSATLPPEKRRQLVEAYSEGEWDPDQVAGYPLITVATEDDVRTVAVEPTPTNMEASFELIDDTETTLSDLVGQWVRDGGCLLVICNTIARAQAAYRLLKAEYDGDVELHHAGFMAWERAAKEDELRKQLGPRAHRGAGRPRRKIVVATQVAEQSLDIDADALITDIAPMDLIIQRAGRVHRHSRPSEDRPKVLREPRIAVRGVVESEPVPVFDPGAEAIYGRALLLSTLHHLPDVFRRPDDIEKLVREAYDPEFSPPEAWHQTWEEALAEKRGQDDGAHQRSKSFRIPLPEFARQLQHLFETSISDQATGAEERGAAQVRDSELTVEAIPIIVTEYGYCPLGGDEELLPEAPLDYHTAFHLAASTVRLPARMTRFDDDFKVVVDQLERATPERWQESPLLRGQVALPLAVDGTARIGRFNVRYSSELGLECTDEKT